MGKSKWPDFLFTLAIRLTCGAFLGCGVFVLIDYKGILSAFAHNHLRTVVICFSASGFIGGLIAMLTTPRWQTPWYKGIASPSAWRYVKPGVSRQELLSQLGQPIVQSPHGEDVWREGDWELQVRYDENDQALEIIRQASME